MATIYTHYKFGQDTINLLSSELQNKINKEITYYNIFNQGFDNLYYYHKNWFYYRTFGASCHTKNIINFFDTFIKYIKSKRLQNNSVITNAIHGILNHYILDTIIHPYINYQVDNLKIPHAKIEFMYDYYLSTKDNTKWNKNAFKTIVPKIKFTNELINCLDYIFYQTHQEKNIGKIFNISHNNSCFIYKIFIVDMHNYKTKLYKIIDIILPFKKLKLSEITFNTKFDERILNKNKLNWHHNKYPDEIYNYSLDELYNNALNISVLLNEKLDLVINNKLDKKEFLNLLKKVKLQNILLFPQK